MFLFAAVPAAAASAAEKRQQQQQQQQQQDLEMLTILEVQDRKRKLSQNPKLQVMF